MCSRRSKKYKKEQQLKVESIKGGGVGRQAGKQAGSRNWQEDKAGWLAGWQAGRLSLQASIHLILTDYISLCTPRGAPKTSCCQAQHSLTCTGHGHSKIDGLLLALHNKCLHRSGPGNQATRQQTQTQFRHWVMSTSNQFSKQGWGSQALVSVSIAAEL